MKAKTRHFPITDFGGRGGLNVPFNLSKTVGDFAVNTIGKDEVLPHANALIVSSGTVIKIP